MTQTCAECTERRPGALERVGEVEREEVLGGKALEVRTHYVCRFCGAKWVHLVESGMSGHGNFWNRE
jgi:hypothetical protein